MSRRIEVTETVVPLDLSISKDTVGGMTGLAPTVALRNAAGTTSYLDWNDNTFKTSGWTTKYASMTEVERGHYQRILDPTAVAAIVPGFTTVAEYRISAATAKGDVHEVIDFVSETARGAHAVTLHFRDSVSLANIQDVQVTVLVGTVQIVLPLRTNASGDVVVNLNAGTYTITAVKTPSYASFTPTSIVVSAPATFNFDGVAVALPSVPADPAKCAVFMDTTPVTAGIAVEATLPEDVFTTSDQAVVPRTVTGTTGVDGRVTLELYRAANLAQILGANVPYRFRCPALEIDVTIEIPNSATAALRDTITSY